MKIYTLAELEKLNYIELGRGNIISKNEIKDNPGNYPVYSSSKLNEGKMGEYNKFMFDEELITWSVDGGGYLFYRSHHKFSITNVTGYLRIIKKDLIDYKYLYYVLVFLHSKIKFDWVKKAHPSILRKEYKNIPLPTIKKQKDLIKIINSNQNIAKDSINKIENNLSNINNLLDKYLGDIFKNFPKETIHKSLKEISNEYGRGKSKHRPRNDKKLFGEKYPFVQTGDVRNATKYINRFSKSYNDVGLKQSKLWKKGTVCITIAANIAEVGILNFDACFPDSVIGIYPNKKYTNSEYIFYLLSSYRIYLQSKSKGVAQQNINLGTFENEKFPFPKSIEYQNKMILKLNNVVSLLDKITELYNQKKVLLNLLKISLINELIFKELRLINE